MNAAFLLLPFLAVRFGLMAALGRDALQRAAHFAPMQGAQRVTLVIYQVSNGAIFLGLFFFQVQPAAAWWFWGGAQFAIWRGLACVRPRWPALPLRAALG